MGKKSFGSHTRGRFPDIGSICVFLDSSRGADYGDDGENVHDRGAGDRLRHRGERGVWFGAGAGGGDGVSCFGGGRMAASDRFEDICGNVSMRTVPTDTLRDCVMCQVISCSEY